jgi:hypothetical protein
LIEVTSPDGKSTRTYVLRVGREAPQFEQIAYVKAHNTDVLDEFGEILATDGETVVVGARLEDSNGDPFDNSRADSGAVYVFVRDGAGWRQQGYLKAPNADPFDQFGWAAAVAGDRLVIGAPFEASAASGIDGNQRDNSIPGAGAVYVYRRDMAGRWSLEAYIKASNPGNKDLFGKALALTEDLLLVGAPGEASAARGIGGNQLDDTAPGAGAVYVFARDSGRWAQEAYIKASNADGRDEFGTSLGYAADVLVVGAPGEDSAARGIDGDQFADSASESGAAYVFRRMGPGSWRQEHYLKASNTGREDAFGSAVAVAGDQIAVGAPLEDGASGINGEQNNEGAPDAGAVYVFGPNGGPGYSQTTYCKPINVGIGDRFGASIALDGFTLAVGAPREDGSGRGIDPVADERAADAGAAYLFMREGAAWFQRHYVKASNADPGDQFGAAIAVHAVTLAVGGPREASAARGIGGDERDNSMPRAGAAYFFGPAGR